MRLALALALLPACFLIRREDDATRCPHDRTFDIGLQEDVVKLVGCKRAAALRIRTGATIDVTPLRELEEVTGDISIGPTVGVDEVAFNGLLRVGGTIHVANNGSLRGLFLPRLLQAGRIEVENNAVLTSISMPRLATVQGSLVIADNASLELITATLLTTIGKELVISNHPKLNLLEMTKVTSMESIRLEINPKLPSEIVEQLASKSATPLPNPKRASQTKPVLDKPAVDRAPAPKKPTPVAPNDKGPKPVGVPVDKSTLGKDDEPKPSRDTGPKPTPVRVDKPSDKEGPKPSPVEPIEKPKPDKDGPKPTPVPVEKPK